MTPPGRRRREYLRCVNAALVCIDRRFGEELRRADQTGAAHLSPFQFHRVFAAIVGETPPADCVRRLRLEKAAGILTAGPDRSVADIVRGCGFGTAALFCRLFRGRFGATTTAWRTGAQPNRKNRQRLRKNGEDIASRNSYTAGEGSHAKPRRKRIRSTAKVKVWDAPPLRVAYVRHLKGYEDQQGIGAAFQTVMCWACPREVGRTR